MTATDTAPVRPGLLMEAKEQFSLHESLQRAVSYVRKICKEDNSVEALDIEGGVCQRNC